MKRLNPNILTIGIAVIGGLILVRSILKGTGVIPEALPGLTYDGTTIPKSNGTTCKSSYTPDQIRTGIFRAWADQVYNAKGYFNDDEKAVYDVFLNKIRSKGDLYLLNQYFALYHKGQVIEYIKGFMSASELAPIFSRINKLPCNY